MLSLDVLNICDNRSIKLLRCLPMNTVIIPTRNRIDALIESLHSLCAINFNYDQSLVVVADNSSDHLNQEILAYFAKRLNLVYYKQPTALSMTDNWNKGVELAIENGSSFISILSDRRLASPGLHKTFIMSSYNSLDVTIFDHQTTWLSSEKLYLSKRYSHDLKLSSANYVKEQTLKINFDGYTPRLFNCIVNRDLLLRLKERFGSYVGGAAPDINFQCRLSCTDDYQIGIHDSPSILTNKRFAFISNGMIKPEQRSQSDFAKLTKDIPYYPSNLVDFVHAYCLGELINVANDNILEFVDWDHFILHLCQELSWFTHDITVFMNARESLLEAVNVLKLADSIKLKYTSLISNVQFISRPSTEEPITEHYYPANMQISIDYFNQTEKV